MIGFRKAKVLGNNNGSTPPNRAVGIKIVDHGIVSSSPSNFSFEAKAVGNVNNSAPHPNYDDGTKVSFSTSGPTPVNIHEDSISGLTPPSSLDMVIGKYTGEMQ